MERTERSRPTSISVWFWNALFWSLNILLMRSLIDKTPKYDTVLSALKQSRVSQSKDIGRGKTRVTPQSWAAWKKTSTCSVFHLKKYLCRDESTKDLIREIRTKKITVFSGLNYKITIFVELRSEELGENQTDRNSATLLTEWRLRCNLIHGNWDSVSSAYKEITCGTLESRS